MNRVSAIRETPIVQALAQDGSEQLDINELAFRVQELLPREAQSA
jgi:hypothetical protein